MMKRLPAIILAISLITAAGGSLAAFDVGGSLTSGSKYNFDSTRDLTAEALGEVSTEAALGLWLESGRGEHLSFEIKTDLIASITNDGFEFYINPDYLKFDSLYEDLEYGPSIFATTFGRFRTSDFSTKIFSQKIDGAVWNFNYPAAELTIAAGTTAFMFADTGSILTTTVPTIMSKTDLSQRADAVSLLDYIADPSSGSLFGSPRAVEIVTFSLPEVFLGQTITLSGVAQEDLRPMLSVINGYTDTADAYPLIQEGETAYYPNRGGAVDTQYAGAGISGSFIPGLYHNIYYYFGTGRSLAYVTDGTSETGSSYQYTRIMSHMAGFSLDLFLDWLFNSRISAGVNFGTGDADATTILEGNTAGDYTQFTPITAGGGGLLFSPGLSNILSGSVSYSLKPLGWLPIRMLSSLQVAATGMPFFRVTEGPIAVSGINPDFTGNYLGSEIDLSARLRPTSDIGVNLQVGYFQPNADAFAGSAMADPAFIAKLNVSLSF